MKRIPENVAECVQQFNKGKLVVMRNVVPADEKAKNKNAPMRVKWTTMN